jgi:hypothetical protein
MHIILKSSHEVSLKEYALEVMHKKCFVLELVSKLYYVQDVTVLFSRCNCFVFSILINIHSIYNVKYTTF